MSEPLLSQEEIKALIEQLQIEDPPIVSAENEFDTDSSLFQQEDNKRKVTKASKVIFDPLQPKINYREDGDLAELSHVSFDLKIVLGEATLTVGELINIKEGSVITLDKLAGENAQLCVNSRNFADGEIVILNDCFTFRVNNLDNGNRQALKEDLREEE